ncbi:hypothetical protein PO486_12640 [Atlantibacter hermannii]|uniref:hypothetical protein n=1 Tax=Atlantibacter hermannii TaxID=565 RepID=UPI0028B0BBA9|nr:hypothetical protein [Atlantibacter hermannii]
MKLIDILVQELPKRGGWPEGAVECCRFVDEANIDFYDASGNWPIDCGEKYGAIALNAVRKKTIPCECEKVTFEQYESALTASQPLWNGEGLPPVGFECEALFDSGSSEWYRAKIIGHDEGRVVGRWVEGPKAYEILEYSSPHGAFRPILSESERKRDEALKYLSHSLRANGSVSDEQLSRLYADIAAGKIPHIQLK